MIHTPGNCTLQNFSAFKTHNEYLKDNYCLLMRKSNHKQFQISCLVSLVFAKIKSLLPYLTCLLWSWCLVVLVGNMFQISWRTWNQFNEFSIAVILPLLKKRNNDRKKNKEIAGTMNKCYICWRSIPCTIHINSFLHMFSLASCASCKIALGP